MPTDRLLHFLKSSKSRKFFIYGMGQVFNLIAPLVAVPYIISVCGAAAYGKVGVALALSFLLIVPIDYGSDIIGVKEVSVNRDDRQQLRKIFTVAYGAKLFMLFCVLAVCALAFWVVPYFNSEYALFYLTLPILIGQYINPIWFLQGIEDFTLITILNISSKAIYLFGVFMFVKQPDDYVYVNLWWGIGMIVPFTIAFIIYFRRYKIDFGELRVQDIRHFLVTDFKFCFSQLFLALKNYSPIMVIGLIGGFTTAGYYKVIEQIVMPFRSYIQMFYRYFYPVLCYEIHNDSNRGFTYWKTINLRNLLFLLAIFAVIFFFPQQILAFFKVSPEAVANLTDVLRFALLLPLTVVLSYSLEQLNLSLGKKELYIKITIATVIFNLMLMFALFGFFGLIGLISSLIITELIIIAVNWIVIKKHFNGLMPS